MSETNKKKVSCDKELKRIPNTLKLIRRNIYVNAVCYSRKVIAKFVSQEALSVERTQIGNDSRSTLRPEKSSRLGNIDLTADKQTLDESVAVLLFSFYLRLSLLRHDRRD